MSEGNLVTKLDYAPYGRIVWNSGVDVDKNSYLWTGKELHYQLFDSASYDSSARFLFIEGSFTSIDPLAEKYPGISPYAYCAGNPISRIDKSGNCFETAFDVVSLVADVHSFVSNIKEGNVSGAIVDGIGTVFDAAAVILPVVPAVAGHSIKAIRAIDKGTDALKAADRVADTAKAADRGGDVAKASRMEKLQESAKTGQEAHRQIEKELRDVYGAQTEVRVDLNDGTWVRKDAKMPDGTYVIIKPDTPSGHAAAAKREKLMQDNKFKTQTIYYNPSNPAYQPGSPTYIGPAIK